jgi:hypothetical protein
MIRKPDPTREAREHEDRELDPPWWSGLPARIFRSDAESGPAADGPVEFPWRHSWDHLPKRSAGYGFTRRDYEDARQRAAEVARSTLGDEQWHRLQRQGYLDLPSRIFDGVTYRMRVGRRIEIVCEPGVTPPWRYAYLCINPTYPLPEMEFFAHLYLYVRDMEEEVIRVAAPQPWDQALGRTF